MSIQEGLALNKVVAVAQGCIYLVSLVTVNYLIIKPAIKLQLERKKRTHGNKDLAFKLEIEANNAEKNYHEQMHIALIEARKIRNEQIENAEQKAKQVLEQAYVKAHETVLDIRKNVSENIEQERKNLPNLVNDIANYILNQMGVGSVVVLLLIFSLFANNVFASNSVPIDFTYGVLWPYIQFAMYAGIVVYFGKKILPAILQNRREKLKRELMEAKSLLVEAQKKLDDYKQKFSDFEKEKNDLLIQYTEDAQREHIQIIDNAKSLALQIEKDAQKLAVDIVAKSKEQLKIELIDLAIKAVEKNLTTDKLELLDKQFKIEAVNAIKELKV